MKKLLLTTTALAAAMWSAAALAADAPGVAPVAAPAYEPAPLPANWTGFYIGAHAGWGWGDLDTTTRTQSPGGWPDRVVGDTEDLSPDGFVGGGQVGYLQQWNGFVGGIEASLSGADIDDDVTTVFGALDDQIRGDVDLLVTATARLGYAMGAWLAYVKGGYAGGDVGLRIVDSVGANQGSWSDDKWHDGYTIGGGIEYMFTPNWTFGVEYSYIDLGSETHSALDDGGLLHEERVDVDIPKVVGRINYKFGAWW